MISENKKHFLHWNIEEVQQFRLWSYIVSRINFMKDVFFTEFKYKNISHKYLTFPYIAMCIHRSQP